MLLLMVVIGYKNYIFNMALQVSSIKNLRCRCTQQVNDILEHNNLRRLPFHNYRKKLPCSVFSSIAELA